MLIALSGNYVSLWYVKVLNTVSGDIVGMSAEEALSVGVVNIGRSLSKRPVLESLEVSFLCSSKDIGYCYEVNKFYFSGMVYALGSYTITCLFFGSDGVYLGLTLIGSVYITYNGEVQGGDGEVVGCMFSLADFRRLLSMYS